MARTLLFISLLFCFLSHQALAVEIDKTDPVLCEDTINVPDSLSKLFYADKEEIIQISYPDSVKTSKFKIKKRIAAILAFPFPFGLLGLHRVFLGTKPYIPFVYIGTLGGCFLILPLVDFIAILSANEEEFKRFENNPRVFMWSH